MPELTRRTFRAARLLNSEQRVAGIRQEARLGLFQQAGRGPVLPQATQGAVGAVDVERPADAPQAKASCLVPGVQSDQERTPALADPVRAQPRVGLAEGSVA